MPVDPKRQAAALEALRTATPPKSEAASFWARYGGRLILAGVLLLGIWAGAWMVGAFVRNSVDETTRAQDDLRRGLRR